MLEHTYVFAVASFPGLLIIQNWKQSTGSCQKMDSEKANLQRMQWKSSSPLMPPWFPFPHAEFYFKH